MARCKLTNMNLRNIRKSKEYQCLLIDFVKTGVIGKTAAEGLLGYTIPSGLISEGNSVVTPEPEDDDTPSDTPTEGGDTPTEGGKDPASINVVLKDGNISIPPKSYNLEPGATVGDLLKWTASKNGFHTVELNTVTPAFIIDDKGNYSLQNEYKTQDTTVLLSNIIQEAAEDLGEDFNSEIMILVVSNEKTASVEPPVDDKPVEGN